MPYRTRDQIALEIIAEGRRRNITARGIVIAIATGLVESNLTVYANEKVPESLRLPHDAVGRDGKSVGVFQQQVVWGNNAWWWGDAATCMDPTKSAGLFFERLAGIDYMGPNSPGSYAQAIQRSAFPERYDQRMPEAQLIYERLSGEAPTTPAPPPVTDIHQTGDPVWLKEVLEAEGLVCHVYPGAYQRGHGDFGEIWGVMAHHTGSFGETPRGIAQHPSLGLASQLYLSRDGQYTLCGVGIAWHAGPGSWPGLPTNNANRYTIGIEAANDGGGSPGKPHHQPWSDTQYDAYVRGVAAILRKLGRDQNRVIGHKEWAGASQGKWDPGGINMDIFRGDVGSHLEAPGGGADDMFTDEDRRRLNWLYDEHSKLGPSRSLYRKNNDNIETQLGFIYNIDAMSYDDRVEAAARNGEDWAIDAVAAVAAGQAPGAFDHNGNRQQWAIDHAKEVLRSVGVEQLEAWKERRG